MASVLEGTTRMAFAARTHARQVTTHAPRWIRRMVVATALIVLAATGPAEAQRAMTSCGDGAGVVMGVVLDASTGRRMGGAVVRLWRESRISRCYAAIDADGVFIIRGRLPGIDSLIAEAWNFRMAAPVAVTFEGADTLRLALRLNPHTTIDDCMQADVCRDWLVAPRDNDLGADLALVALAYQTAVVLGWKHVDRPLDGYVCLPQRVAPAVFAVIRARHTRTVSSADCAIQAAPDSSDKRHRFRHTSTGQPAFHVDVRFRT